MSQKIINNVVNFLIESELDIRDVFERYFEVVVDLKEQEITLENPELAKRNPRLVKKLAISCTRTGTFTLNS